ncbi:hypothetical protein Ga0061079_10248 [Apibacter mensalis]|uniref:Uncharacterized protein n=2 Tax=Apibacter mensalis TaxID=1586267 RepID=A0A0X3AMA2_9FLAO|nr:hypothetical protein Ga0061079_10248 [Apibacter mensalis]
MKFILDNLFNFIFKISSFTKQSYNFKMDNKFLNQEYLELHYFFNDNSHSMDAIIYNKNIAEILKVIGIIADSFKIEVNIEIEPVEEGGLISWLKIITKSPKENSVLSAIIITLATSYFVNTPSEMILKIFDHYITSELYQEEVKNKKLDNETKQINNEIKKLELEELKFKIENKRIELLQKNDTLKENIDVKNSVSNFYKNSDKYNKIDKIGFQIYNFKKEARTEEFIVDKSLFKNYIVTNEKLEPLIENNVIIEIVSPVLKKGANYTWKVLINGNRANVRMESNKFKSLIQAGTIEFKNGSKVICELETKRRYDAKGEIKVSSYNILTVYKYIIDSKIIDIEEEKSV